MYFLYVVLVLGSLNVSKGKPTKCKGEFPCNDGSCIPMIKWCDGHVDCEDDSDEDYCSRRFTFNTNPNRCRDYHFLCKDGRCIPIVGRCDGTKSCTDGSDEEDCGTVTELLPTTKLEFTNTTMHDLEIATFSSTAEDFANLTTDFSIKFPNNESYSKDFEMVNIQSDSSARENTNVKAVDVEFSKGYLEMDFRNFTQEKLDAEIWLTEIRDDDYGWHDETARAITALYISNPEMLNRTYETRLIVKQLHLQLFSALLRNHTDPLTTSQLASFINALYAICANPRNFYGQDLVDILRKRTDAAQNATKYTSPLVYLTLCISNATEFADVKQIDWMSSMFSRNKWNQIDAQALVTLAAVCISSTPKFFSIPLGQRTSKRFLDFITHAGLPEDVYQLSLAIQALNEARINQNLWKRSEAMKRLRSMQKANGSFGNILSTYYALPLFSGKSIVSLAKHCNTKDNGLIPLEVLLNGTVNRKFVTVSLSFGSPKLPRHDITMQVGESNSIMDIMRIAEFNNAMYRIEYSSHDKPQIYSIGGVVNDAEHGLYWTMCLKETENSTAKHFDGDIRSYVPNSGVHIRFWMKNVFESNDC